jgi:shikimate dehydrogenase
VISGKTVVLGLFGDPVEHSLSPQMHARFAENTGADTAYVPFRVSIENLEAALHALPKFGIRGVNITVPHKEAAFRLLSVTTEAAKAIGAVNTVIVEGDQIQGDNTDAEGFLADLKAQLNHTGWESGPVVVLGAGGAARAVVHSLKGVGVPEIIVANRTEEKGHSLVSELIPECGTAVSLPGKGLLMALSRARLLVNTTTVGLRQECFEGLELTTLPEGAGVYDLIYSPKETPLLRDARSLGLAAANGLGMLVRQGAASYQRWTNQRPDADDILVEMENAFRD